MGVGTPTVIDAGRLRAIRMWCRRHADQKSALAKRILPLKYAGLSHEQIRIQLGLTVEGYRRVKRWLNDSVAESNASADQLSVDEALGEHADHQVDLVTRFAQLRQRGRLRGEVQERLGLSDEAFERTDEWFRDALAATEPRED